MMPLRPGVIWLCIPLAYKGGTMTHLRHWARELAATYQVHCVFAPANPSEEALISRELSRYGLNVTAIRELRPTVTMPRGLARWFCIVLRERPALIHSIYIQSDILAGITGRLLGIPVLSSLEGDLLPPSVHPWRVKVYRALYKVAAPGIRQVVAISAHTLRSYAKFFGSAPAEVVYSGVRVSDYPYASSLENLKHKLTHGGVRVGYFGRITREKGVWIALRVFEELAQRDSQMLFLFIGDGEDLPALQRAVRTSPWRDRISIYSWLPPSEALTLFDIMIHPSTREGLPWSILEAMGSGKPVVATAVGGIPEVIQAGKNGVLVRDSSVEEFVSATLWLTQNPQRCIEMAKQAHQTVAERFSSGEETKKLRDLYSRLMRTARV